MQTGGARALGYLLFYAALHTFLSSTYPCVLSPAHAPIHANTAQCVPAFHRTQVVRMLLDASRAVLPRTHRESDIFVSASAFSQMYSKTGLVGISAASTPGQSAQLGFEDSDVNAFATLVREACQGGLQGSVGSASARVCLPSKLNRFSTAAHIP
eukprot:1080175-Pelagomonas_calceolata.AAC.1